MNSSDTEGSWKDRHAADLFVYERLMQRIVAQNALIWQTPSLGLAAQAFLLTTSLSSRTGQVPRVMASAVGVGLALMTMQLMAKHRFLYRLDQAKMDEIEKRVELPNLAHHHLGTDTDEKVGTFWLTRQRSFLIWESGLFGLLLMNVAILLSGLLRPDLFAAPR